MDFEESISQVAAKVRDLKGGVETEEATKNAFILPFIGQVLGYDVFNPNEVIPEFTADVGLKKGEKVDYALVRDGKVQILIECKKVSCPLSLENASQLYRYFAVTDARIAVLTNGQVWNFYMDIDEPNRMDSKPFLVLDLLDADPTVFPALQKLTKPDFDLDSIASSAEELKYVGPLKRAIGEEFKDPSPDFVKLLAGHVYEGAFYASVMEKFQPLVAKALKQFLSDQVNDRLKTALGADDVKAGVTSTALDDAAGAASVDEDDGEDDGEDGGDGARDGVVTTEEELDAYHIIKAIACSNVDPSRITLRDAKAYCAIFLDDNNRKPIARLYFNTKQKYLGLFGEDKQCERVPIETLDGIYAYADRIRQEVDRVI
ncbi:type I restriction endonuclease [Bifidobacterium xylocopae]|uniref:Restriction endonuclease n=1 Tax=Bifidobacterium xylocopae TaxID=2493119 RepID=A0A366KE99_9BIFI|nr:type I restriction endonuclease [Bifidobacterium xylocopae]RBQ00031.1 restriction endonuclease [Bifidobacterium xylocopae]